MSSSPPRLEDAADQLVIAKWMMRELGYKYGITITFAPKITVGKAGSGMHMHTRVSKDGKNMYVGENGLSEVAMKTMAGILSLAGSLTAFGNTNPTSYFRLVPHQEAPTNICWGDRNRSAMVRVPLGWSKSAGNMMAHANPLEKNDKVDFSPQADHRAAHARRQRQYLPAAGRHDGGGTPRLRDAGRRAVCQGPLCQRQYLRA